jgi:hypothetical protein
MWAASLDPRGRATSGPTCSIHRAFASSELESLIMSRRSRSRANVAAILLGTFALLLAAASAALAW